MPLDTCYPATGCKRNILQTLAVIVSPIIGGICAGIIHWRYKRSFLVGAISSMVGACLSGLGIFVWLVVKNWGIASGGEFVPDNRGTWVLFLAFITVTVSLVVIPIFMLLGGASSLLMSAILDLAFPRRRNL